MRLAPEEEGKRWLEQGEEDLKWASDLCQRGGYYLACFLSQQAAEKVLKAFLYAKGEELMIGHSIERLSRLAGGYDEEFIKGRESWRILDGYYIPPRYPNAFPENIPARVYTEKAAKEAVSLAQEITRLVKSKLETHGLKSL